MSEGLAWHRVVVRTAFQAEGTAHVDSRKGKEGSGFRESTAAEWGCVYRLSRCQEGGRWGRPSLHRPTVRGLGFILMVQGSHREASFWILPAKEVGLADGVRRHAKPGFAWQL